MYVQSYKDLDVYKISRKLAKDVFNLTENFPKDEKYSLTSQIRRSSRSVGAQIAEAWAKRRYPAHFISKLTDADGEQQETQHWIDISMDCGYIDISQQKALLDQCLSIGKMLNVMISKASQFCGKSVKEDSAWYQLEEIEEG